jgi:hypothetical protein
MTRPVAALAVLLATTLACQGKTEAPPPPNASDALAEVAAARSLPAETYSSPVSRFDLTFPGVWTGRYRAEERTDTTDGGRLRVDFKFRPDSGSRAPSQILLTLRVFPRATWQAIEKRIGRPFGARLGERGDEVFLIFLPESNPYPAGSPEAPVFDRLIIALSLGGQQVHLSLR